MGVRMARAEDAAALAGLMWQAMPEVVALWTGSDDEATGLAFLKGWCAARGNLYSFENTLVFEDEGRVVASVTGYDGARFRDLRAPLALQTGRMLADETQDGEWYVDTLSVASAWQGRGMGRQMMAAFAGHARAQGGSRLGLLVAFGKADAKRLYERMGFVVAGEKYLAGEGYYHMVRALR